MEFLVRILKPSDYKHIRDGYKLLKALLAYGRRVTEIKGSGCRTSGRAMAFCLGRPGSNPGTDLGFFQFRIVVNLFSLGVSLFLITCN